MKAAEKLFCKYYTLNFSGRDKCVIIDHRDICIWYCIRWYGQCVAYSKKALKNTGNRVRGLTTCNSLFPSAMRKKQNS